MFVYICVLYSFVPNLYSALEGRVGALVQVYAFLLIRLDLHGAGERFVYCVLGIWEVVGVKNFGNVLF